MRNATATPSNYRKLTRQTDSKLNKVEKVRETIRNIPATPTDTIYNLAWVLGLMGDFSRAVPLAKECMRRLPIDLYAYVTLAILSGLAGFRDQAREAITLLRERYPKYRIPDFESHEPFRDRAILDRVVDALRSAGLPH